MSDISRIKNKIETKLEEKEEEEGDFLLRLKKAIKEIEKLETGYRVTVEWYYRGPSILDLLAQIGTQLRKELLGEDDRSGFFVYYLNEDFEIVEMDSGYSLHDADPRERLAKDDNPRMADLDEKPLTDALTSDNKSASGKTEEDSKKTKDGFVNKVKKLDEYGNLDYLDTPQCPECGSQKVGEEAEHVFQCRECSNIFKTGENINIE